ncbi:hypothetical protein M1N56_03685 [Dehalococcoidia bacterium]|nr:hypothetical protein [Dehalococcoidia bacterium]
MGWLRSAAGAASENGNPFSFYAVGVGSEKSATDNGVFRIAAIIPKSASSSLFSSDESTSEVKVDALPKSETF